MRVEYGTAPPCIKALAAHAAAHQQSPVWSIVRIQLCLACRTVEALGSICAENCICWDISGFGITLLGGLWVFVTEQGAKFAVLCVVVSDGVSKTPGRACQGSQQEVAQEWTTGCGLIRCVTGSPLRGLLLCYSGVVRFVVARWCEGQCYAQAQASVQAAMKACE